MLKTAIPKPLACRKKDDTREFVFDSGELRAFVETSSDRSFVVYDQDGVGISIAVNEDLREVLAGAA